MGVGSRTVGAATAFFLLLFPAVAEAGHAPLSAQFSPKAGNEWWVEVYVTANHGLAGVDARVDGGSWKALEKKDWGSWAKSFFVPTGSIVEFRARASSGESVLSGKYEWPSAKPISDPGPFDAVFSPRAGNEWWVETNVATNKPLAGVDARVDGGSWRALEKKSWGTWAKSFFVPTDSVVEFRARATSGESEISGRYLWPSATPIPDEPPDTFHAAFAPKAGNEWWMEVLVNGDEPVASVEARLADGPWHALEKKSWGAWAASFQIHSGIIVTFRAHSEDGSTATSMGFRWPDARPVDGGGFDATFIPREGNEWWVEVSIGVPKGETIAMAHLLVNDQTLHEMGGSSWGNHVFGGHVPSGSIVQFQVQTSDGKIDHSGKFRWPDATRVSNEPESWPQEGSYAHYRVEWGAQQSIGAPRTTTDHVFIYSGGTWHVACSGTTQTDASDPATAEPYHKRASFAPPKGPTFDMQQGFVVSIGIAEDCAADRYENMTAIGYDHFQARQNGRHTGTTTWYGEWTADCNCMYRNAEWDVTTGMVLYWHSASTVYSDVGYLMDTDAPIS